MAKRNDIVALIIGRGNNTLKDKNILPVLGKPLLQWGALAAKRSEYIGRYYLSSDCERILKAGENVDFKGIVRPDYLSTPTAQSSDVVLHALETIEKDCPASVLIVIHANVGTISTKLIDECISILLNNEILSSVVPSHRKDEYHPLRARKLDENGVLIPFVENYGKPISANRQDLEMSLFYDHSFWVLDVEKGVKCENGQLPWPVMGNKIMPYITEGCFDVHDLEDLEKTAKWIENEGIIELYQSEGLL